MNRPLARALLAFSALGLAISLTGCGSDRAPDTLLGASELDSSAGTGAGTLTVKIAAQRDSSGSPGGPGGGGSGSHNKTGITALILTFDAIRVHPVVADSAEHGQCSGNDEDMGMHDGSGSGGMHGGSGGGGMHGGSGGCGMHGDNGGGRAHDPGACEGDSCRHCEGDSARYIDILTGPVTVDTSELGPTLTSLLTTASLPAGNYSHLALRISAARVVTAAGVEAPATVAMGDSLLRVMAPFEVADGQVTSLVLTIDPDRSVRETPPGSGRFFLRPVLRASVQDDHHGHGSGGFVR